jgi:hypothetical protein
MGLHIKTGALTGGPSLGEGGLTGDFLVDLLFFDSFFPFPLVESLSLLLSFPFFLLGFVSDNVFAFFEGLLDFLEDDAFVFPVGFVDFVGFL